MNRIDKIINKLVKEATSDRGGGRGSYVPPIQPGLRPWKKEDLGAFSEPVSDFKSPLVQYDSYDHKMDLRIKDIKKLEKTASKIQNYIKTHPFATNSDEDGNVINQFMHDGRTAKHSETMRPFTEKLPFNEWVEVSDNLINEITTTVTAGEYNGPQELGMRHWTASELGGFSEKSSHPVNKDIIYKTTKKNIRKTVGSWEAKKGKFEIPTADVNSKKEGKVNSHEELGDNPIVWYRKFQKNSKLRNGNVIQNKKLNEDLAVWFGKKKKPKGSSQPKGPWVDICRKVDGKHPPCGRNDADKGSYPKCRAAGVAGKMSDSQKRSACQQKRTAEKKDTQTGKGQKPVMTSYKPRKK